MMKLNINCKKLISLAITGGLAFSICGCMNTKNKYISMSEIFYDEDAEGIDDFYESRITDGKSKINQLIILEDSISLIRELMKIDYQGVEHTLSKDYVVQNIQSLSIDDVNQIKEELEEYNALLKGSSSMSEDEKNETIHRMRGDLYEKLVLLIDYLKYHGRTDLYCFGDGLYSSIILDAMGRDGDEHNIEAYTNAYMGSSSPLENTAYYKKDGESDSLQVIYGSAMYELISETQLYQDAIQLPEEYEIFIRFDKDMKDDIEKEFLHPFEKTIAKYKKAMATSYRVNEHRNSMFDERAYDYDIECGHRDESIIKK